ncbi:hypothetical protein [Streptomyces sp. TRM64462]|uniref:hypothetical protein n=1 Tax=Streptomyces sp. TRM64462 TaxID=2741726 RepID=UPI001C2FE862|nr:hypothetical protein [Streptomyces sp. TRM64462]
MSERDHGARRDVPEELAGALAAEVSLRSRMRYVAVGLAGGCMAALIAVLWATEPGPLPARTRIAFAGMTAIGLAWAVFAGWVLTRRRPLFARDRVLGARLALAATTVTGASGTALATARGTAPVAVVTALGGAALAAAAGVTLARARSRHRELLRLRDTLRNDALRAPGTSGTPHTSASPRGESMNHKTAPVGPLAIALRRLGAGKRTVFLLTALLCAALLIGAGLLLF